MFIAPETRPSNRMANMLGDVSQADGLALCITRIMFEALSSSQRSMPNTRGSIFAQDFLVISGVACNTRSWSRISSPAFCWSRHGLFLYEGVIDPWRSNSLGRCSSSNQLLSVVHSVSAQRFD